MKIPELRRLTRAGAVVTRLKDVLNLMNELEREDGVAGQPIAALDVLIEQAVEVRQKAEAKYKSTATSTQYEHEWQNPEIMAKLFAQTKFISQEEFFREDD